MKTEKKYILILESSYFLAVNSIMSKKQKRLDMTIEYYNQFIDNYPESKFNESAKKIFDVTQITIEQLKLNKDEFKKINKECLINFPELQVHFGI